MYLQLYIVVSVSCQPFISSFCAVILLICGVDIRRQAAWLAWHDPHLCWEVHVLVSNVNIRSNQHMANSFCARTKSKSKLLKMFCYQNERDLMELWVQTDGHWKFKGSLENCTVQLRLTYICTVPDRFGMKSYPEWFSLTVFWIKLDVTLFSTSCRISKSILTVAREKWMQQLWRCRGILNYCTCTAM